MSRRGMQCPHCGERCAITSTNPTSAITRESYVRCKNDRCGWVGKAYTEIYIEISPAAKPNPAINLKKGY